MKNETALVLGFAALTALAACGGGEDKGSSKSAAPASSAAPAKTTAPAATTAKPADAPAAPAVADKAAQPAGHSDVPTVAEWNAVTGEITVRGSSALGCETKGLREWVRISCRGNDKQRGEPTAVNVTNGGGKEVLPFSSGGITSIVYRFEAGTKVEATFKWERLTKKLVSEWPAGAPKPEAYGEFR